MKNSRWSTVLDQKKTLLRRLNYLVTLWMFVFILMLYDIGYYLGSPAYPQVNDTTLEVLHSRRWTLLRAFIDNLIWSRWTSAWIQVRFYDSIFSLCNKFMLVVLVLLWCFCDVLSCSLTLFRQTSKGATGTLLVLGLFQPNWCQTLLHLSNLIKFKFLVMSSS